MPFEPQPQFENYSDYAAWLTAMKEWRAANIGAWECTSPGNWRCKPSQPHFNYRCGIVQAYPHEIEPVPYTCQEHILYTCKVCRKNVRWDGIFEGTWLHE